MQLSTYAERLRTERARYEQDVDVHALPPIFYYWAQHYLKPRISILGFEHPQEMFNKYVERQCASHQSSFCRFISIGSGNCDFEIELACHLRSKGYSEFVIECLDLNSAMLERGRAGAAARDVLQQLAFIEGDINAWQPSHQYQAVLANMSLHHVVGLERLFDSVKGSLTPNGIFAISDMIGRNGHQRWPEALAVIHEFWHKLPPSYRINRQLNRYEDLFQNWDCSTEGFEGIRSQDILPLLIERFQFQLFFAFGNAIDPFIDRGFGHNFSVDADWDRAFIDSVQARDHKELLSGRLSPTHMFAVVANESDSTLLHEHPFTPGFCVRKAIEPTTFDVPQRGTFGKWSGWPHDPFIELQIICSRLAVAEEELQHQRLHAAEAERDLKARSDWALSLEAMLNDRTAWALKLRHELDECSSAIKASNTIAQSRRKPWAVLYRIKRLLSKIAERTHLSRPNV